MKKILLTGAAGFIGSRIASFLLRGKNIKIVGVDNLNGYYDPRLKKFRLRVLRSNKRFVFEKIDIENQKPLRGLFKTHRFDTVMNLAAQVGVGPSVRDPFLYLSTNVKGTLNLLELAREYRVRKFFLSSSSSVYTGQKTPFSEDSPANTPYSSYAATKEAAEALCYSYHYLYGIDMVIARFFTVYGPGGRPDMAPLRFVKRIYEGTPLPIYGDGRQTRDFTYVDDIANGSIKALSLRGHHILNFGNNRPVSLMEFIRLIEKYTGKAAILKMQPSKKIDARNTWANITKAKTLLRWHPRTSLEEGVRKTVAWYLENRAWLNKIL